MSLEQIRVFLETGYEIQFEAAVQSAEDQKEREEKAAGRVSVVRDAVGNAAAVAGLGAPLAAREHEGEVAAEGEIRKRYGSGAEDAASQTKVVG